MYAIFWRLELQDLTVPENIYSQSIKEKELEIAREQKLKSRDRTAREKADKKIAGLQKMVKILKEECYETQKTNVSEVKKFLRDRLAKCFEEVKDELGISVFLLQNCIYPRLMISPADALYSIKFLKLLVELKVPKMNVLNIFAQVLKGIVPTIHCCTNNEAENLGLFLMEYFQMIDRWTRKETWDAECANYSGFSQMVGSPDNVISFDYYLKKIMEPIHVRFSSFLKVYLQNPKEQFMKTRCALKILFRIRSVFPKDRQVALGILTELKKITEVEKDVIQKDILTLAQRYKASLDDLIPTLKDKKGPGGDGVDAKNKKRDEKPTEKPPQRVSQGTRDDRPTARRVEEAKGESSASRAQPPRKREEK